MTSFAHQVKTKQAITSTIFLSKLILFIYYLFTYLDPAKASTGVNDPKKSIDNDLKSFSEIDIATSGSQSGEAFGAEAPNYKFLQRMNQKQQIDDQSNAPEYQQYQQSAQRSTRTPRRQGQ